MKNKQTKEKESANTNVVDKVTLKILNDRHNALARYVGAPCIAEPSEIIKGAATSNGSVAPSEEYMCYRVNLKPFKGHFSSIRFRATSNGDNVVFGYLKNKKGKIESVAKSNEADERIVTLPLTKNSIELVATMPLNSDNPVWKDIKVELLCNGVVSQVNDALNCLLNKIRDLENKIADITEFVYLETGIPIA